MKEKIRKHINELFKDAPKTRRAVELKEEMAQNTIEKYEDLIAEGHKEEDAFRIVVGSIGDVTELFEDLKTAGSSFQRRELSEICRAII